MPILHPHVMWVACIRSEASPACRYGSQLLATVERQQESPPGVSQPAIFRCCSVHDVFGVFFE